MPFLAMAMFLVTLSGCVSGTKSNLAISIEKIARPATIASRLAAASGVYYFIYDRWPGSVDELQTLRSGQVNKEQQELALDAVNAVPWGEIKGNARFQTSANGGFLIEVQSPDKGASNKATILLSPPEKH
jgi:hypothetical protein